MDKDAAEAASKSDWFQCKLELPTKPQLEREEGINLGRVDDPSDTSCIIATLQGDEETCKATLDRDGQACEWCSVASAQICLNSDQAAVAEQLGGDCSDNLDNQEEEGGKVDDPSDTSCIIATLQGDEESCEATLDRDGQACEWCSVASAQICLNSDQAALAEQLGGDCSDNLDNQEEEGGKVDDPSDTSCIIATLQGDEDSCKATLDEWCSVASAQICLNSDQAALAEQLGGDCGDAVLSFS
jgi:ankyrin repeat protein